MIPTDFLPPFVAVVHYRKTTVSGSDGLHLPCTMLSGSVIVSCSPPSGTRHTRIFASSPACRVEMEMCTLSQSSGLQKKTTNKRKHCPTHTLRLTHGETVRVERVPGEVDHTDRVLDGGQRRVWEPAGLRALGDGEETPKSPPLML